jgi:hypothetical protein
MASMILFLAIACGTRPIDNREVKKTDPPTPNIKKEGGPQSVPPTSRQAESAEHKVKASRAPSSDPVDDETSGSGAFSKIDWGREAELDEIIGMAKRGEIQQLEWHVMPNVIRAQARDNRIFHIRNENKGVDIRNALMDAGIRIGKDGIPLRYVF